MSRKELMVTARVQSEQIFDRNYMTATRVKQPHNMS